MNHPTITDVEQDSCCPSRQHEFEMGNCIFGGVWFAVRTGKTRDSAGPMTLEMFGTGEVRKGARRMPRCQEPTKDGANTEMPRGAVSER